MGCNFLKGTIHWNHVPLFSWLLRVSTCLRVGANQPLELVIYRSIIFDYFLHIIAKHFWIWKFLSRDISYLATILHHNYLYHLLAASEERVWCNGRVSSLVPWRFSIQIDLFEYNNKGKAAYKFTSHTPQCVGGLDIGGAFSSSCSSWILRLASIFNGN
jgi:hypothetical protein